MVGVLLFQILLLGITGSLGHSHCDCEPCKYVPDGQYKGLWENPVQGSPSCPQLNKDPVTFGCLYTKYNSTETACFCDPGDTAYDVCFDDIVKPGPEGSGYAIERSCCSGDECCCSYCTWIGCRGICSIDCCFDLIVGEAEVFGDVLPVETICVTDSGASPHKPCIFPFQFNGVVYNECTWKSAHLTEHKPWCSTLVDETGHHVGGQGKWGNCGSGCPIPPDDRADEEQPENVAPVPPCCKNQFTITKGTLVKTLPTLGKLYHISFTLTPTNYVPGNQGVIHFTTGSQTVKIPDVYAEYVSSTHGKLVFCNSDIISNSCSTTLSPTYPVNAAITIVCQQLLVEGQYYYQVYINGATTPFVNEPNPTAVAYSNVDVYISDPWNPALGGTISNLCINPTLSTPLTHCTTY